MTRIASAGGGQQRERCEAEIRGEPGRRGSHAAGRAATSAYVFTSRAGRRCRGGQLHRIEGLRQDPRDLRRPEAIEIGLTDARSEVDHRDVLRRTVVADALQGCRTVQAGHHDVEHHDIRTPSDEHVEACLAGVRGAHLVAADLLQAQARERPHVVVIVDYENPLAHRATSMASDSLRLHGAPLQAGWRRPPVRTHGENHRERASLRRARSRPRWTPRCG